MHVPISLGGLQGSRAVPSHSSVSWVCWKQGDRHPPGLSGAVGPVSGQGNGLQGARLLRRIGPAHIDAQRTRAEAAWPKRSGLGLSAVGRAVRAAHGAKASSSPVEAALWSMAPATH